MFGRGGVVAIVYRHTEMPFAKVSGGVTVFLEHFGYGRFTLQQMHLMKPFGDDGIDPGTIVVAARKEGGARRGTTRRSGMEIGEAHAPGGQLVEDRGLDGAVVTAKVTVAQVVDK